jgi:putative intracellular protease/amidase
MRANPNVTRPERRKRILLIAANPAVSPTTGRPVGFWWAELTHPFWAFTEAGYEIAILGSGRVGGTLGAGLAAAGHDVVLGVRDPDDPKHRETAHRVATVAATPIRSAEALLSCLAER